ncbi:hypothetical protein LENED_003498 [Lentinula edodes]|uniref:Uncharacterized protein n=1 Tax=Lentinula edodes TaxID=5353 RepID=A0A1Q3E3P7_LENED|nr:hypothetical protein LENED_003498 [Lentinula edodes]
MHFISFSATILAAISYSKVFGDFIAWSGNACDGDEGLNVPCDNGCDGFEGRHSFEVVASGTHCVTFYEDEGCGGEHFFFSGEGNSECINVNTGTSIGSFSLFWVSELISLKTR